MRGLPSSIHKRIFLLAAATAVMTLALGGFALIQLSFWNESIQSTLRLDSNLTLLTGTMDAKGQIDEERLHRARGSLEGSRGMGWRIITSNKVLSSPNFPVFEAVPGKVDRNVDTDQAGRPRTIIERDSNGNIIPVRRITLHTDSGPVTFLTTRLRNPKSLVLAVIFPFMLVLAVMGTVMAFGTALQLRLGLRPLRRLREDVAAIRSGEIQSISEDQTDELRPLAIELNAFARDNAAALSAARTMASNLAHALKTPVSTLALDLRNKPALAAQVARIDKTIRHHLGRARSSAIDKRRTTALAPAVADLVSTISRIQRERRIAFKCSVDPSVQVAVDPTDLDEILGNLIDNAARFAIKAVSIHARIVDRKVELTVVDDGPGIPAEDRAKSIQAGIRLDERGSGYGFGLAITADLVKLYGGTLRLEEAADGGLDATVTLPVAGS